MFSRHFLFYLYVCFALSIWPCYFEPPCVWHSSRRRYSLGYPLLFVTTKLFHKSLNCLTSQFSSFPRSVDHVQKEKELEFLTLPNINEFCLSVCPCSNWHEYTMMPLNWCTLLEFTMACSELKTKWLSFLWFIYRDTQKNSVI